jgi:inorganic pyrophosphatase
MSDSTTQQTPSANQEIFKELCEALLSACESLDQLKVEKNVDALDDLKYEVYSNLLEVQDAIKDMLKAFRKKYKITERQVRDRMKAEDGEGDAEDVTESSEETKKD